MFHAGWLSLNTGFAFPFTGLLRLAIWHFTKLFGHRGAFWLASTVVDDSVDHSIIIFHLHFCILQRLVRQKTVQFMKAIAIYIVCAGHTIYLECHYITD